MVDIHSFRLLSDEVYQNVVVWLGDEIGQHGEALELILCHYVDG